ncbi:class I SAM-dependent methyltransferase [Pseudomonadota bacterium]
MSDQEIFKNIYRGHQGLLRHCSYMRMSKVLLAIHMIEKTEISLEKIKMLDYGFGAGTLFRYIPKSSALFGVEQDPVVCEEVTASLHARGHANVDLSPISLANWREHRLLKTRYDLIVCSHVLEHLHDPVDFLTVLKSCLEPNGVILGLVPLNERVVNPHHVQKADHAVIKAWANDSGLRLVAYEEADPWIYWLQPLYTHDAGLRYRISQAVSLGLGIPATLMGSSAWFALGKIFARLTSSLPNQAVFVLEQGN